MKISKIEINRFGPLKFKIPVKLGNFNLFWGSNETGKTLTIEAILKSLPFGFRGERGNWEKSYGIRVGGEGDVVLELEDGGVIYSQRSGKLLNLPLTRNEIIKLFFILNSDVAYELNDQKSREVLQNAMDKLTSTYVNEINAILRKLLELNNLTEKLDFSDSEASGKLKSRIAKADTFIEQVDSFLERIKREDLVKIEFEIASKKRRLEEIAELEERAKQVKRAQIYKKTVDLLERYEALNASLQSFKNYDEESLNKLRQIVSELNNLEENLKEIKEKDLRTLEEKLKMLESQLSEAVKVKNERQRVELTEKLLREKIVQYKAGLSRYEQNLKQRRSARTLSLISGILFIVSILLPILTKIPYFFALTLILFGTTFYFVIKYSMTVNEIRDFKLQERELFDRARSVGIKSSNVEEIENELESRKAEIEEKEKVLERLQGEKSSLDETRIKLIEKIQNYEKRKTELSAIVESELGKLNVEDLKELEEKVTTKKSIEENIKSVLSELKGLWGHEISYEDDFDLIIKIGKEINRYKIESHEGLEYAETQNIDLSDLDEEKKKLIADIDDLSTKLQDVKRNYIIFENDYLNIMGEPVSIETVSDLLEVKAEVEEWRRDLTKRKNLVVKLIKIIEEEYKESKARFSDLFTNLSDTSWIFSEITGQKYKRIIFDKDANSLKVEDATGNLLDISLLSGGTLDQLFFAIRLGIGRKILGERKGFFVLDDPFLKSDTERLKRELDLLMKVGDDGWQILYFTCKAEVRDYLTERYGDRILFIDLNEIAEMQTGV
ncbi:MAG: ATP-binding protein [Candidatus Hydrothermia bacterium]